MAQQLRAACNWAAVLAGAVVATVWLLDGMPVDVRFAVTAAVVACAVAHVLDRRGSGDVEDGWATVRRELERSRRHERCFTLAKLDNGAHGQPGPVDAGAVRHALRSGDVLWSDIHGTYVLLPETDGDGARRLCERLDGRLPGPRIASLATFPANGVTIDALLVALEARRGLHEVLLPAPNGNGHQQRTSVS